jgi:hypothetical protein
VLTTSVQKELVIAMILEFHWRDRLYARKT